VNVRQPPSGPGWKALAGLDPLAAVLDPGDTVGTKNALIDRVHKRALLRGSGPLANRAVLDFGCGTGRLTRFISEQGGDPVGVDATVEMVDAARLLNPWLRFEHVDGRELPFADATFDVIVTAYVLQYYVGGRGLEDIVAAFSRVLRPGGRLVAIEQVGASLDRGAEASAYAAEFGRPPFMPPRVSPIRSGSSRLLGLAQSHRLIRAMPLLPEFAGLEARRAYRRSLAPGTYVDMLFVAQRQ
jgi:SAM-dependent methyltransferase